MMFIRVICMLKNIRHNQRLNQPQLLSALVKPGASLTSMFTYAPGIDRYVSERLSGQRNDLLKRIDQFLFLHPRMYGEDEKHNLSTTLPNKICLLYEEIWSENETLQASISSLRYIFEAVIHAQTTVQRI